METLDENRNSVPVYTAGDSVAWIPVAGKKDKQARAFLPVRGLHDIYTYGYKARPKSANYFDALTEIQIAFNDKSSEIFTLKNGKKQKQKMACWRNRDGSLLAPTKGWIKVDISKLELIDNRQIHSAFHDMPVRNTTTEELLREQRENDIFAHESPIAKTDSIGRVAIRSEAPADERVYREILTRRGQASFRMALIEAFEGCCCVTGSSVVSVLEAAHIVPHSEGTDYAVTNGLLLRSDIHTLFDLNLLGIDEDGHIHFAEQLVNSEYREFNGVKIMDNISSNLASNLEKRFNQYLINSSK